jgi:hypothetical protein
VIDASSPARAGFKVLTVLYLTVGIATALGMLLRYLTLPPLDQIQTSVQGALTGTQLYQSWVQSGSTAAVLFDVLSRAFWLAAHLRLDYPTRAGILLAPLSIWIGGCFVGDVRHLRRVLWSAAGQAGTPRLLGVAGCRQFASNSSPVNGDPGDDRALDLGDRMALLTTYRRCVTFPH